MSSSSISLTLEQPHFDKINNVLKYPYQPLAVRVYRSSKVNSFKQCLVQARLQLNFSKKLKRSFVETRVHSKNCEELNIKTSSHFNSSSITRFQIIYHLIFTSIVACLMIFFLTKADKLLNDRPQANIQISEMSLLITGTFGLVLGFEQLVLAVLDFPLSELLVTLGILFFASFFFVILRLVATILKTQINFEMQRNFNFNLKSYLFKIYVFAHASILLTFYCSLKFGNSNVLYIGWTFCMVPQIAKNFTIKTKFLNSLWPFTCAYTCIMLYVLYSNFFKGNFFYVAHRNSWQSYEAVTFVACFSSVVIILTL